MSVSLTERNALRQSHEIPGRSNNFLKTIMGSTAQFHGAYDRVPEEHTPAFTVETAAKIPELNSFRSPEVKRERMMSLLSVPNHKPIVPKFDVT